MAYIRSRKHSKPSQLTQSLVAIAAVAAPLAAQAQQAEQTMSEIKVQSAAEAPYKADSVSPKYTQPLVDTPQTITVIREELIAEQGATTLTDALRNSPGVGTFYLGENGNTQTGDAVMMRGFDSSSAIFVDDVRDLGSISRDMFNVSQVEVLKGPAGTDTGRGSPTGSINVVTKQAQKYDAFSSSLTVGTAKQKRITADWNKVINADNGTAFRVNLMKQDSGVPGRDEVKNDRTGIAAAFAYGLGSGTRVFADFLHARQNDVPDGGVPTIGLPGYSSPAVADNPATPADESIPPRDYVTNAPRVKPSNFYGLKSDYNDVEANRLTLRVEHDISPDVTVRNTTRYGKSSQDYLLTAFMGTAANLVTPVPGDRSTWTLARSTPTIKDQTNEILTNQTSLTARLNTGSVQHTIYTGVEFTRETQKNNGYDTAGALPPANLYNPSASDGRGTWTMTRNKGLDAEGETKTVSAYLFDTIKLNEQWMINGGVRADRYETEYRNGVRCVAPGGRGTVCPPGVAAGTILNSKLDTSGTLWNWKLAGVFKPTENSSIYALYATSQQPPGGANFSLSSSANSADNPDFDPQKTRTIELGTKWDLLDKRLQLSAAVFRTNITNGVEADPTSPSGYSQNGEKQVKGYELGVVGAITDNWNVMAGYSHLNTEVVNGALVTQNGENALTYTPKNTFTSWTTYKIGNFTIGGGARYVGKMFKGTDSAIGTPAYANGYWVYDAMAGYQVSKNVDLRLNIYNLTDKEYVASINKSGYRYTPGGERAVTLTANITF